MTTDTENTPRTDSHRLRARFLFPGDGPPIEDGMIVIENGRITDVTSVVDATAVDLGNVAIIPGLVNAHTHLEFSDLPAPLEPTEPFTDWIRSVVAHRNSRSESTATIIQRGLNESTASGTTMLGEIASEDADDHPAIVRFRELIGFSAAQIEPQLAIAGRHLKEGVQRGISPHAPYTVHPELLRRLVALARESNAPIAMHLAETPVEIEFLEKGTGPFVEMLKTFGVWEPGVVSPRTRPLEYLRELATVEHPLAIHGNYLNDEEIDFLVVTPHLSLVFCPRTHAYFHHTPHRWRELLERGGSVTLGTDSRASNLDLSLWKELQFLQQRHPDVDPLQLLQLGTLNGAQALGLADETGSLHPAKSADLAIVELRGGLRAGLYRVGNEVSATMSRGRWLQAPRNQ